MKRQEQGNALFLILIAVVLFAALSYAVTQSGRSGGDANKEQTILNAAQWMQHGAMVRATVQRMVLTGTAPANIGLNCTTGENCVFAPEGGGIVPQDGWDYKEIPDGNFVKGMGTAAPDIFMIRSVFFNGPDLDECIEVNRQLGLPTSSIPTDADGDSDAEAYDGEPIGCYGSGFLALFFYTLYAE